ncbi:MAG: peptidoglycan DD-metalloendopeptidase family protein [Methylococcales bacterium]|nr:peptidoglycan DD-metalloendopeptidase family protein [Methylococcales bacterium]
MFSHVSRQGLLPFLIILMLLNACTTGQPNYAPVVTNNGELAEGQHSPGIDNRNRNKANQDISGRNPTIIKNLKQLHRVKNREFVSYGYQHRVLANYPASALKMMTLEKVKFSNPAHAGQFTHKEQPVIEKIKTGSSKKIEDSVAYKTGSEDINIYKKPRINSAVFKKAGNRQQKSIISIDNKNILELNFGWPIKGRVLKSFSPGYNKGIDIAGKLGESVNAAEAGEVVYCGQGLIGLGQLLIIKHNKAYLSAYANNRRVLVTEGQQVEKGQAIAEVGKIGARKRASLHFEIRKNGSPVNPLKLLPKR